MIIYKITNKVNGKVYIGQTVGDIKARWRKHKNLHKYPSCSPTAINHAIVKYGENNFTVEKVATAISLEELNQKEIQFIAEYNCVVPNGYNIETGGDVVLFTQQQRRRLKSP